ncbi:hypothetical protein HDU87_003370 [Geranomyces variabilis]|uniref:Uncharacterized protein n=1 Tax=Geranomyces variabilis TaxID=109894 RepID=A0AAD5XN82_9FUNG|nr:hypothetical protein HDU87_003370 [Geranomyces variabilis]
MQTEPTGVEGHVKLDAEIMRRASRVYLQSDGNIPATESFRAKMIEDLGAKGVKVLFSGDFATVKLFGPTKAVVDEGAAFVSDKFSRRFKEYIAKRSGTWSFQAETIWDAETTDTDLSAMVANMAQGFPGIRVEYSRGDTYVDIFLVNNSSGGVPMAILGQQCKAIERSIQAKKRELIEKQKRDHADETAAAAASRTVHMDLAPFLPESPLLTPPPGLAKPKAADENLSGPAPGLAKFLMSNVGADATEQKALDRGPPLNIVVDAKPFGSAQKAAISDKNGSATIETRAASREALNGNENRAFGNVAELSHPAPAAERAAPVRAEAVPQVSTLTMTEPIQNGATAYQRLPAAKSDRLSRRFIFLSDEITASLKEGKATLEALVGHLECIESAYGIEFVVSTECGGVLLKGGPARDLDDAQEDLEDYIDNEMRELAK